MWRTIVILNFLGFALAAQDSMAQSAPQPPDGPSAAVGTAAGACYGNATCNAGLMCSSASNQCVPAPVAPPPPPLPPAQPQAQAAKGYESHDGFTAGFGLGASFLTCDGCDGSESGLALDFCVDVMKSGAIAIDLSGRISTMSVNDADLMTFNFVLSARWR